MRVIVAPEGASHDLGELYAFPDAGWVRANLVSTLDGAAVGTDGRSGSINNDSDTAVFSLQRAMADAVLVGSNTVSIEGYGRVPLPSAEHVMFGPTTLVVVSGTASVPEKLLAEDPRGGPVVVLTTEQADAEDVARLRSRLGSDNVWVVGDGRHVDLELAVRTMASNGLRHVMAEGGPTVFGLLLEQGLVNEVALTWTPTIVGGSAFRITEGPSLNVPLELHTLCEHESTLLGLWRVTAEPR
ncbi:MAG: dihydrofolate reductase family protein [Nostocoides sp.]